jgi:hypothetical protein
MLLYGAAMVPALLSEPLVASTKRAPAGVGYLRTTRGTPHDMASVIHHSTARAGNNEGLYQSPSLYGRLLQYFKDGGEG